MASIRLVGPESPSNMAFRSNAFKAPIRLISAMLFSSTALCSASGDLFKLASMKSFRLRPRSPIVVARVITSGLPLKENTTSSALQPFFSQKTSQTRCAFVDALILSRTSPLFSFPSEASFSARSAQSLLPACLALTYTTKLSSDRTLMMSWSEFSFAYSSGVVPNASTALVLASYLFTRTLTVDSEPPSAA